jgi:hypothetical protein
MNIRFGTGNVRSFCRAGSLKTVAKCNIDLVAV